MTRAEMKKLYGRIFLGILIFAALIGGIHFTGEIQRRLKGDEQNLGRAAEAELRFRQYENFRLDVIGRSEEYEAALRKYITPAYFGDTDLRKYFAYTEVEVVHYEQIEVME